MREIVHLQAGQCGNQIGSKVLMSCLNYIKKKKVSDGYGLKIEIVRGER